MGAHFRHIRLVQQVLKPLDPEKTPAKSIGKVSMIPIAEAVLRDHGSSRGARNAAKYILDNVPEDGQYRRKLVLAFWDQMEKGTRMIQQAEDDAREKADDGPVPDFEAGAAEPAFEFEEAEAPVAVADESLPPASYDDADEDDFEVAEGVEAPTAEEEAVMARNEIGAVATPLAALGLNEKAEIHLEDFGVNSVEELTAFIQRGDDLTRVNGIGDAYAKDILEKHQRFINESARA